MLDGVSTSSANTATLNTATVTDGRARGRHRVGQTPESAITALLREHPRGVPYPRRRHRSRSARTAPLTSAPTGLHLVHVVDHEDGMTVDELARFLFEQLTAIMKFLAQHVDDGLGHRQRAASEISAATCPGPACCTSRPHAAAARSDAGRPPGPPSPASPPRPSRPTLGDTHIRLTEPLAYPQLLALAQHARVIVTDSGGLQEEATVLKKPIIVVRRSNERPEIEGVFGCRIEPTALQQTLTAWINDAQGYARLRDIPSPYGDGKASARIATEVQRLRAGTHCETA